MAPTLYYVPPSPPARAVLMCAKHLNLTLNLKFVDIQKGENRTPEYIKMNPQHTVPVLVDGDVTIWDSHAILIYLVKTYGKGMDSLYPYELNRHIRVHQMMHFENGVLFQRGRTIMTKFIKHGQKTIDEGDAEALTEAFEQLDLILEGRRYAIGETLTIADFSLMAGVPTASVLLPTLDVAKYRNVQAWLERVQALPAYQVNEEGLKMLGQYVKVLRGL